MNENEVKRWWHISIYIFILILFLKNSDSKNLKLMEIYKLWGCVNTFGVFYFWEGWKIPLLKKLIQKDNLNGSWFGEYNSIQIDDNNKKYKGEIAIQISQNFFSTKVKSFTINQNTVSISANIDIKEKKIYYFYLQETKDTTQDIRKGGAQLTYNNEELDGPFFTNGNTNGYLKLRKVSKKKLDSFKEIKKVNMGRI